MAKIIVTLNDAILDEFPLVKVRANIGRRPTNEIHLDNLAISGEHATVVKMGSDYFIEDMDSTNGTLVNGEVTKKQLLKHQDIIELGKYQLKFLNGDNEVHSSFNAQSAFEKTMMMHPSAIKSVRAKKLEVAKVSDVSPSPMQAPQVLVEEKSVSEPPPEPALGSRAHVVNGAVGKIQVLNGSGSGRELVLNKALTTLGRTGVQVAVITKRPQGYFITHVEGKVLPVVNGVATGGQAFALQDHDVIELAGVKMEFYLTQP